VRRLLPCSFAALPLAFRAVPATTGALTPNFLQVSSLILLAACCEDLAATPLSVRKVSCIVLLLFCCRYLTCGYLQVFGFAQICKDFAPVLDCCSRIWFALVVCKAAGATL
jgi:hypothetical protein